MAVRRLDTAISKGKFGVDVQPCIGPLAPVDPDTDALVPVDPGSGSITGIFGRIIGQEETFGGQRGRLIAGGLASRPSALRQNRNRMAPVPPRAPRGNFEIIIGVGQVTREIGGNRLFINVPQFAFAFDRGVETLQRRQLFR